MECASRSQKVCPHLALKLGPRDCSIVRSQKLSHVPQEPPRNYFVASHSRQQRIYESWDAADKAKGTIKEGAGKLSGDKDMETEGKLDKEKDPCTTPRAM